MTIRSFRNEDFKAVLEITLLAFAPIHESFHHILGDSIFNIIYPDWRGSYDEYLTSLTNSDATEKIIIAEQEGAVIAFAVYSLNQEKESGELGLNAVHPAHQNKGIGPKLYEHILEEMKKQGIKIVEVATGGDASHAPARRAYEKCGFTPLPLVRYYKAL